MIIDPQVQAERLPRWAASAKNPSAERLLGENKWDGGMFMNRIMLMIMLMIMMMIGWWTGFSWAGWSFWLWKQFGFDLCVADIRPKVVMIMFNNTTNHVLKIFHLFFNFNHLLPNISNITAVHTQVPQAKINEAFYDESVYKVQLVIFKTKTNVFKLIRLLTIYINPYLF